MTSPKHIQDELTELESSLPFNNNLPFSVPEGYFEGFAASVLAKLNSSEVSFDEELQQLSPLLSGISKTLPYSVPSAYFEANTEFVPDSHEDIKSPLLEYIGLEMPYSVPQGYFEAFHNQILERVLEPKTKVVPLFARTWAKMAAAAVVTGALVLGGMQLFSNNSTGNTIMATKEPVTETYVAQNTPPVLKEIKQTSTKELEEFIETVQVTAANSKKKLTENKGEVQDLLKDVSTNEMETFLSELSSDEDDLSLTN